MKRVVLIALPALMLALLPVIASGGGSSQDGCSNDCASCHSLSADEALELLKTSFVSVTPADARVKEVAIMETVGLWKVTLDMEGEKPLFIDFGKKNVFVGEFYPLRQPLFDPSRADLINAE